MENDFTESIVDLSNVLTARNVIAVVLRYAVIGMVVDVTYRIAKDIIKK